jgi:hypothetical protein
MTEWRDLSHLPEDSGYWNDLEKRIMSELGPQVRAVPATAPHWLAPLAARAWGLTGLAAAAAIAALLLVPPRKEQRVSVGLLTLPGSDPSFTSFVSASSPPPVGALLLPRISGGRDD